jgi:hypothetical protein
VKQKASQKAVIEPMGVKIGSVYTFIAQVILSYLVVLLFLIVTLVILGNAPVLILVTPPGMFLQLVLMFYCWLLLFAIPNKPQILRKQKSN